MEISTEASRSNMEPTTESSDKSVHYYNKKSNSYSSQAEAMSFFEEGNLSMNNGDYGTAIENYKRCLENADKDNVKMMVYFGLGNAYTLSDNWEEGLNSFNHYLKFSSKVESEYFEHQVYLGLGSVHSTMKRLEEAMKKDEMECLCHIALGGLNKLLENYEQSLEHYRKGFSLIIESQQQQHEQHHRPRRPRKVGGINEEKYVDYFLRRFPELPLLVHKIIRSTDWKTRPDLKKHFTYTVDHVKIEEVSGKKSKEVMDNVYLDELQLHEWKYNDKSTKHKELFLKLIEYGKDPNVEVKHVDDVRVIFSEDFLLGKGSDGTRVYLGLGKDGYGKAVKRILRDTYLAQHEEKIFNEINAKKSDYVLNYYCSRQDIRTEYVYLILDLCEESLERFVLSESNSLDYLQKSLPNIFKQILNGLVDLHSDPRPILHRDLKPSNVLRDTQGKFLISDFGISRILKNDSQTYVSDANRGTPHWIAPESYIVDKNLFDKGRYKTKSDVMNAGMVAYFVATKGKHPFGTKVFILQNLLDGKPVGLKEISNVELNDLLSWMLQHKPELRPSAKEALKHPYLLSDEEMFDLLCKVGNQPEIKIAHLDHPLSSDIHEQLNGLKNWKGRIDPEVFSDFNVGHYDTTWLGCLKFIQNVYQQWKDEHRTKLSPYIKEGNYKEYFVRVLPELPLLAHRIMRLNDMAKGIPIQELLHQPWTCFDKSRIHQKKFKKMEEYGRKHPEKVTLLSELRVIFKEEFLLGKGSDGTRVYLALGNNGYGKAVKRIHKDSGKDYANREKEIFNVLNAKRSNYVVNFWDLKKSLDEEYLYMILDLCEESLESYVNSSSLQDLQKVVPKVLIQILNGLAHLHSGQRPILHRDLRPSNVLRDVQGNFLIADFGISHMLSDETLTHESIQRGAKNWIAPESYDPSDDTINKVRYKKESDIMNAGMVAYYVATKGKHPFGHKRHRLNNILNGNPVGLDEIKDATFKDLLSWMLQLKSENRPSANEALKHPYLQSDEENFNMLCDMGNQLEVKHSQGQNSPTSVVHTQLYGSTEWMKRIDDRVVKDLINFEVNDSIGTLKYESTWAGCLRFIRNVDQQWQNKPLPRLSQYIKQGNYKEYFLEVFPELPLLVHKVKRSTDWKSTPDLEEHFPKLLSQPWKCYDKSIMHQQKFRMMEKYGQENPRKVKLVNGVKVICSEEFLLGKGSDGTRVYLGLGKDGYGKVVKRLLRDNCVELAKREKDILNELNAKRSNYVVNYWYLEEEPGTDYLYLILDLCEESLESYVKSSSLQDLQKVVPKVLIQILNGLVHLHSGSCPILHRDLRPSNVLRDVDGNFLIADFGISRKLLNETSTHRSIQRGAKNWIAPESYNASDDTINKVRSKKSLTL
ncbi:uncharacterized protein LOC124438155 [Xenia sp. Carnegie-2017]|uniref:uncharacterized protein LOC124438155 n=1 Tax=Xenia sp. Carnegie-2017 TaxID=2897299 RepID=UPI001F035B06|nr:uncharacterized protein LOC124438155 [Xenia sp. Carnegie-2017]